jgi:hypothetical protein
MSEKLTPEEVARLDPFGVRKIPASEELKELLKEERETKGQELREFETGLIRVEKEAWRRVLGVDLAIPPLPTEISLEVKQKLEKEGFTLVFLPSLDLSPNQLKTKDPAQYLKEFNRRYPNWRPFESLSDTEKSDHKVSRNLEKWLWERVKKGEVDFPTLPGSWLAVETLPKPNYREKYQKTAFGQRLGFEDRFNVSCDKAEEAVDKAKPKFFSDIGLRRDKVRFLGVLEWNLLANRFGWGETNTYEWTNTEYRAPGGSRRLIVGYSDYGGAADVLWHRPGYAYDDVGFRLAVVFGS